MVIANAASPGTLSPFGCTSDHWFVTEKWNSQKDEELPRTAFNSYKNTIVHFRNEKKKKEDSLFFAHDRTLDIDSRC